MRASQYRLSSALSPPRALFSPFHCPLSGAVCSAHVDRPFCSDAVRAMNLSAGERGITFSASVAQLKQAKKQVRRGGRSLELDLHLRGEGGGAITEWIWFRSVRPCCLLGGSIDPIGLRAGQPLHLDQHCDSV